MIHMKKEKLDLRSKNGQFHFSRSLFATCFSLIFIGSTMLNAQDHGPCIFQNDSKHNVVSSLTSETKSKSCVLSSSTSSSSIIKQNIEVKEEIFIEDIELDIESLPNEEYIFVKVEEMPEFPGGDKALAKFLNENLIYPKRALDDKDEGTVFVQFLIDKDGCVQNVHLPDVKCTENRVGGGCEEEAMRVVNSMPKWKPGKQRGKAVEVGLTLPVRFQLLK